MLLATEWVQCHSELYLYVFNFSVDKNTAVQNVFLLYFSYRLGVQPKKVIVGVASFRGHNACNLCCFWNTGIGLENSFHNAPKFGFLLIILYRGSPNARRIRIQALGVRSTNILVCNLRAKAHINMTNMTTARLFICIY